MVERTIAWLHDFRRLRIRWERRDATHQGLQDAGIRHSAFRHLGAPMPFLRVTFAAARPILPTAGISTKPHPTVRRT